MASKTGTGGIVHTIHVADVLDNGDLDNFRKVENVVDAMNMPNGTIKFTKEGEPKAIESGKIVRSTVRGLDESFRYRCSSCKIKEYDIISPTDRGSEIRVECPVCEKPTSHERKEMDDI